MKPLVILICLLQSFMIYGQDDQSINLLTTEDSWRKEAFTFPKPFAPEVNFDGVADVRFAKGWEDKTSDNFWSYAFGWKIAEELSEQDLEHYLQLYFDGLMEVVNRDKTKIIPPTIALFLDSEPTPQSHLYTGKIKLYDAFFTQDLLALNVNGEYRYCPTEGVHLYLFRLSPQPRDSEVWKHLDKTGFNNTVCNGK